MATRRRRRRRGTSPDLVFGERYSILEPEGPSVDELEQHAAWERYLSRLPEDPEQRTFFAEAQERHYASYRDLGSGFPLDYLARFDVKIFGRFEFTPIVAAPDERGALTVALEEVNDWVAGICMNGKLKVWIE